MSRDQPSTKRVLFGAFAAVLLVGFGLYFVAGWANISWLENQERIGAQRELEVLVSQLPLGSRPEKAVEVFGAQPVKIIPDVLGALNGTTGLLTGRAAEGMVTQRFDLHTWNEGHVIATVAYDKNGVAAGKWFYGGGYGNRSGKKFSE